ncbi:MAG TPA: hypothetical protein VKQ07_04560 [Jatrophihabitantaceae bacterium]|nr:hypothetical protein [Jatrophihabitantaceae bacterium]
MIGDRWGVTEAETQRHFPCDDVVPSPVLASYVLVPEGAATRLLLKIVTPGWRLIAPLLSIGDLVMARRQLLTLKQLAEQTSATAPA